MLDAKSYLLNSYILKKLLKFKKCFKKRFDNERDNFQTYSYLLEMIVLY